METVHLELATPVWVTPGLSLAAVIGVALPLFVVTMASQNVPGVAVIRASGFPIPISPVVGWTGVANFLLAPFGAFTINLACNHRGDLHGTRSARGSEAALCCVRRNRIFSMCWLDCLAPRSQRYSRLFPHELVAAIAGLALIGTIGNGLAAALASEREREAALITFLVTCIRRNADRDRFGLLGSCCGWLGASDIAHAQDLIEAAFLRWKPNGTLAVETRPPHGDSPGFTRVVQCARVMRCRTIQTTSAIGGPS
jgi:hypothetical protein